MRNRSCQEKELTIVQYDQEGLRRELNLLQKEIGTIKKAKGDASELLEKKAVKDKQIAQMAAEASELLKKRDAKASLIGNIVDKDCHVSLTEVGYQTSPVSSCVHRHCERGGMFWF